MGSTVPGMTEIGTDWRVVDGVATAWFDAPSLIEGAALAGRIVELSAEIVVDLPHQPLQRGDVAHHLVASPHLQRRLSCWLFSRFRKSHVHLFDHLWFIC